MYTCGRKKADVEPTPPAHDPRNVETIERLQKRIQEFELQRLWPDSPAEEAEPVAPLKIYKDLLRACPHHGFTELHQLDTFYNALNPADQDSLNSAAGGNLLKRCTQDVLTIIENKSKGGDDVVTRVGMTMVVRSGCCGGGEGGEAAVVRGEPEPNVWDDEPEDVNPFGGGKHRYRDDPIRSLGLKIEIPEFIGKSKVETWEKMKKLTKAKFLLENHRQVAFLDYHNMSQQIMTMEEVINEFDKLRMRCDVVEEEEQVVAWFLGVLKPEIADIVSLQPYWTYTDVWKLALKVEKQIKAKTKGFTSRFTPPTRTAPYNT
uniref:Reverse transcriptase domain-containing protein n=1 Tax=Tanacetum cinerariifolium TaxID=118510 RepID=A0A6L2MW26_TANCI|nr:reverse transcriptase domain-containing protein [Tanacetum cinerariifolium]